MQVQGALFQQNSLPQGWNWNANALVEELQPLITGLAQAPNSCVIRPNQQITSSNIQTHEEGDQNQITSTLSNKELLSCIDPIKSVHEPVEKKERAKTELCRKLLASKGRLKIEFNELSSSDCEILEGFATDQFMSSTGGDYEVTKCWQSIIHELFQIKSDLKFKEMKMKTKTKGKRGHGNTNLENKFQFQIPARPTYNMNMNNNIHRTQLPSVPSFTFNASMEASANIGTRFDNSGEQKLNGLINHNGHVSGTANGSIFVLYNCNFHARTPSN